MGTHAKLALTKGDGTHRCVERTESAEVAPLLGDWIDAEEKWDQEPRTPGSRLRWTPQEMDDLWGDEANAIFDALGGGSWEEGDVPGEQEMEWETYLHVDWSRKVVGIDPATYASLVKAPGKLPARLGIGWQWEWASYCAHDYPELDSSGEATD